MRKRKGRKTEAIDTHLQEKKIKNWFFLLKFQELNSKRNHAHNTS